MGDVGGAGGELFWQAGAWAVEDNPAVWAAGARRGNGGKALGGEGVAQAHLAWHAGLQAQGADGRGAQAIAAQFDGGERG